MEVKERKDRVDDALNATRAAVQEGVIVGEAQAIDLNLLSAPPEDLDTPFYSEDLRDEIERVQRWLPDLEIR